MISLKISTDDDEKISTLSGVRPNFTIEIKISFSESACIVPLVVIDVLESAKGNLDPNSVTNLTYLQQRKIFQNLH